MTSQTSIHSKLSVIFASLILLFAASGHGDTLHQTIRGQVLDSQTKQPLIGANVILPETEPTRGASTNLEGYFFLPKVSVGRHDLKVSYMGYEDVLLPNILVTSGKEVVLLLELKERFLEGQEVVVELSRKHEAINQLAVSSVRGFTVEETGRYAGSRADPARMASNYAGVVGGGDMRNDIIVRGNSPFGVLWRMDGMDIPDPNHFNFVGTTGGLFSMLNNNLLANSDFISGAFPAEYGNKTAAVFDLRMRNGNSTKREYVAQIGLNGLEFGAEGGISGDHRSSYLINFRTFNFEPLEYLGIDFKSSGIPRFKDLSGKVNFVSKSMGTFSLFGVGGRSHLALLESERDDGDWDAANSDDISFGSDVGFVGLEHKYIFNQKVFGRLGLLQSWNHVYINREWIFLDQPPKLKEQLDTRENQTTLQYDLSYKRNSRNYIKMGVSQSTIQYDLYQQEFEDADSLYYVFFNEQGTANQTQMYLSWQHKISKTITLNTGMHGQRFKLLEAQTQVEPRASIMIKLTGSKKLNLGYGLHSQSQPLIFYNRSYPRPGGVMERSNQNLDFSKSHHFVLGYEQRLNDDLYWKLEAYFQSLYSLPVAANVGYFSIVNQGSEFSFYVPDSLENSGTGSNYGLEVTLEKFFDRNLYYLLTTSVYESLYTGADGIERHSANDVGYVINALAGYEWWMGTNRDKAVLLDLKAARSGGKRYIPVDLTASIAAGQEVLNFDRAYSEQFDAFSKIDIKLSYRVNKKSATHFAFVAIDNVLNTQNMLIINYNADTEKIDKTYQLGLFPYLGYRVEF